MQLFFSDKIAGDEAILTEEEAHHCLNVLRHNIGDSINVTDGKGGMYKARITAKSKKECTLSIEDFEIHSPGALKHLTIAIAPTKNIERFEWFIEKAIEVGIHKIIPITTSRSERNTIKPERIHRIAVSAMKQSNHLYLPEITELTKWNDFLKQEKNTYNYIAHCNTPHIPHLKTMLNLHQDVTICIGPEGDFTVEEVKLALDNSFLEVGLGNSRLRTETAGVYAAICFHVVSS